MAKLSESTQDKLDFYLKGSTLKQVAFTGPEQRRILGFIKTTVGNKITRIGQETREQVRVALYNAQKDGVPFLTAVNNIVGSTDLPSGIYKSTRQRAAVITSHELTRARQAGMFAYGVDEGIVYWTWICILSKGSCELCVGRHRQTKRWETWLKLGIPPSPHMRCKCGLIPGRDVYLRKQPIMRAEVTGMGVVGRVLQKMQDSEYFKAKSQLLRCSEKV